VNRAKQEFALGLRVKRDKGDPSYIYYEGHHIVPKCMGGKGSSKDWMHDNIVPLTAKEHFLAHKLLVEMYPNHGGIIQTFCYLCRLGKKTSGKDYQRLKNVLSKEITKRQTGKKRPNHSLAISGENHFFFGKKRPEISSAVRDKLIGNKNATKKIVDLDSGTKFGSVNQAALYYEVNPRTITRWANRSYRVAFL